MPGVTHVHQGLTPVAAELLVVPDVEVGVRLVPLVAAAVARLQGEAVGDAHVPEHDPPCRLLRPGHREPAVLEVEAVLCILVQHQGEKLFHQILLTSFSTTVKANLCISYLITFEQ